MGRKLLIPGGSAPVSTLHVAPVSGATEAPATAPARTVAAEPAPKPAPPTAAAPKPVQKAKAPAPAPIAKAEPAPAPKKAETPAPAPPTKLTQAQPPAAPALKKAPQAAPPPETVPVAEPPKAPNVASLPPSGKLEPGRAGRVEFAGNATKLPDSAKGALIELANRIKNESTLRLQLMAYAGGEGLSSSLARRMSLSRALSVRSFLIENGVRSTRIDVRALGNKTTEEPVNRVDLTVAER